MNYRNCKVTFRMQTPICFTYPYVFGDSLITHLQVREFDPVSYRKQDSKVVNKNIRKHSKEQCIAHNGEFSHASISILDSDDEMPVNIYKRFEGSAMFKMNQRTKWRPYQGQGHFRNHIINLIIKPCRFVHFYMRAKPDRLKLLLSGLPSIGKKSSIGFGAIQDYSIETIKKDYSIEKDGIAMRPIPMRLLKKSSGKAMMNYKPPYWSPYPELCAVPGAKIEWKR